LAVFGGQFHGGMSLDFIKLILTAPNGSQDFPAREPWHKNYPPRPLDGMSWNIVLQILPE
jgi:hypothetical protein